MRKLLLIGILAVVACALGGISIVMADDASTCGTTAYYSRQDQRRCPLPYCSGNWLYEPPSQGEDPCVDDLTLVQYVTGIFVREDDGTLTRIFPDCNQALTGSIEPDPNYPGFEIFVYLAYVP